MTMTKEMSTGEVVEFYPQKAGIFRNYIMGCFGYFAAPFEHIEQGEGHQSINVEVLIANLNNVV